MEAQPESIMPLSGHGCYEGMKTNKISQFSSQGCLKFSWHSEFLPLSAHFYGKYPWNLLWAYITTLIILICNSVALLPCLHICLTLGHLPCSAGWVMYDNKVWENKHIWQHKASSNKGEKNDVLNNATKLSNNSAKRQETLFPSRVRNLVISVNGHLWFTGCWYALARLSLWRERLAVSQFAINKLQVPIPG